MGGVQGHLGLAIMAGLGGMVGWGVSDFFAKKAIDEVGDVTTLFWAQLLGVVPLGLLYYFQPSVPALSGLGWVWLAVLGAWSGLSYIPTYVAFGKGKVSLLSPVFASYAVVVAILSAVVLREAIPPLQWFAFAVVFLGVLLINGDKESLSWLVGRRREHAQIGIVGLPEILLAICLYSAWLIALDKFVSGRAWVPLLLVIRIFSAVSLLGYGRVRRIKLAIGKPGAWKYLALIGLFDVAAFSCVTLGFSQTSHASVVAMPPARSRSRPSFSRTCS